MFFLLYVSLKIIDAECLKVFLIVDYAYERQQKKTYLSMLLQVSFLVPLLIGLLFLYPCLAGKYKVKYTQQETDKERDENARLINNPK